MITVDEYKRRVDENTNEYNRQKLSNSFDLKKYHGFDCIAGTMSRCVLMSKPPDIICAIIIGALPILNKRTGADAIKLDGIIFVEIELKSCYTDISKFMRTTRGTIYSVTPDKIINGVACNNDTTALKSCFNASYTIKDNLSLKGVDTYLILLDSRDDSVIDCFVIPAAGMIAYLNTRKVAGSGNLQIKLATFLKLGKQYGTVIPVIGLSVWSEKLLPMLPLIHVKSKKAING